MTSDATIKQLESRKFDAKDLECRQHESLQRDEIDCQLATKEAAQLDKEHYHKILRSMRIEDGIGTLQIQLHSMGEDIGLSFCRCNLPQKVPLYK
jgi:hypothetical protein